MAFVPVPTLTIADEKVPELSGARGDFSAGPMFSFVAGVMAASLCWAVVVNHLAVQRQSAYATLRKSAFELLSSSELLRSEVQRLDEVLGHRCAAARSVRWNLPKIKTLATN